MDREFMKSFCKNYYSDFEYEAIKDSELYKEKRIERHNVENELILRLQEHGEDVIGLFEKYLDAYADEIEVHLEEMYLMGAEDREKMLRGII